jgi:para-nitrobenzyl esterase
MKHSLFMSAAFLAAWAPALAAPVAITQNGKITGVFADGMREFLGVRYAAPPDGPLRWQPTQPMPQNLFSDQATAFGPHCAQLASPYGVASTSEDCLYLNVFAPKDKPPEGTSYPVMVWIHGGALVVGESDDYDPKPLLASNKVIVVTLNYRLGYLGYLAETGLDGEGHTAANYGLMDQQFALSWINRNIAGFGGDPGNITVFGESAGGLSTLSNLISPSARGLFTQAIVESGSYSIHLPSLSEAETAGNAVAEALGCADTDVACLRNVPVANILAQQTSPTLSLTTIVDGTTLPLSINTALSTGVFNRVPVMNGTNHDEYRQFLTEYADLTASEYPEVLDGVFGDTLGAAVAAEYPVGKYRQPVLALAAAITDFAFACPARLIDRWASRWTTVYAYEFNDLNAPEDFLPPTTYRYGASHASEIQFLFDIPKLASARRLDSNERELSKAMRSYWTSFAIGQTPNSNATPNWLTYDLTKDNMQSLTPPNPGEELYFNGDHNCRFWEPVIKS